MSNPFRHLLYLLQLAHATNRAWNPADTWNTLRGAPTPGRPRDLAGVQRLQRGEFEIAWLEYEFTDPIEKRLALARCAVALRAE